MACHTEIGAGIRAPAGGRWVLAGLVWSVLQSPRLWPRSLSARQLGNSLSPGPRRLKVAKDDLDALRLLARASIKLGRDSQAMALYERLGPQSMSADDFYLLGTALCRSGGRKGGVEVWEQALKADPNHPEILLELTGVYLEAARYHDATTTAKRLAKQPNWQSRAFALLGKIQLARNDPAGAIEFWQRTFEHESQQLSLTSRAAGDPQGPGYRPAAWTPALRGSCPVADQPGQGEGARYRGLMAPEPGVLAGRCLARSSGRPQ